ncbi:MAG: glycosyltransferase [Humibacillus sp.]|nr:glycosyltransferase [Humibacillus sp.]MDN5776554.1 glycosyltransferase [Humibacillus sp.]
MQPKVSVIISVYNPGANIDLLIHSLAAQTLVADQFEVLFIDDGSTDGTGERLHAVVATHPTWSVKTIPNSGWPGRPRNVGTDLATGEYVFFADHDDEFLPEALERMYALGHANGSDIVYPKLVRVGRPTPYWNLAHRTMAVADPLGEVLGSRTVHKMYRRQFLQDCGARFPEGPVRLEDHNFTSQVIPHAGVISVVADYPCYKWIHRSDGSNNSTTASEAHTYWGYYTEVVRVAERTAGPGPLLDRIRVVAMLQAFSRLSPTAYLKRSDEARQLLFAAVHAYVVEQFAPELDPLLPSLKRMRVKALRSGDRAGFEAIQRQRTQITFHVGLAELRWDDSRLHLALKVTMDDQAGAPFELERQGEHLLVPAVAGSADAGPAEARMLLPEDLGTAEVTVRNRRTGVEWPVATTCRFEPVTVGKGVALSLHAEADVNLAHGFFGAPLEDGTWSLAVRAQFLGESLTIAVPATPGVGLSAVAQAAPGRNAVVLRTGQDKLVLRVSADVDDVKVDPESPSVKQARWCDGKLILELSIPSGFNVQRIAARTRGQQVSHSVSLHDGTASITIGSTAPGDILDFYFDAGTPQHPEHERRLMFGDGEVVNQAQYRAYRTQHGAFSVKHVRNPTKTSTTLLGVSALAPRWIRRARRSWRERSRG